MSGNAGKRQSSSAPRALGPQVADAVRTVVAPHVQAAGLYLEQVKLTSDGPNAVVRVILDLPEDETGSLGSDRLDEAALAISRALDEDDVVPGKYVLEVSTPGVSRPLTELRHYKRARGRLVELSRSQAPKFSGRLVNVRQSEQSEQSEPVLEFEDGTQIPLDTVQKGKVKVEFGD